MEPRKRGAAQTEPFPRCPAAVKGTNVHHRKAKSHWEESWEGGQVGRPEPENRSIHNFEGGVS